MHIFYNSPRKTQKTLIQKNLRIWRWRKRKRWPYKKDQQKHPWIGSWQKIQVDPSVDCGQTVGGCTNCGWLEVRRPRKSPRRLKKSPKLMVIHVYYLGLSFDCIHQIYLKLISTINLMVLHHGFPTAWCPPSYTRLLQSCSPTERERTNGALGPRPAVMFIKWDGSSVFHHTFPMIFYDVHESFHGDLTRIEWDITGIKREIFRDVILHCFTESSWLNPPYFQSLAALAPAIGPDLDLQGPSQSGLDGLESSSWRAAHLNPCMCMYIYIYIAKLIKVCIDI